MDTTRREVLGRIAAGAAIISTVGGSQTVAAQTSPDAMAPVFRGQNAIRPLAFDPTKLKGLSERLIRSHWENNYQGAVRALNAIEPRLDPLLKDKDLPAFIYGDVKREEALRTGSMILHEYYFGNLGGDGKPGGEVLNAIRLAFGSLEAWESEFKRTANALGGGSGWVVLAFNLHTGQMRNHWSWDHLHNVPTAVPLLVLDMYEHAYHMDYGAAAGRYIDAFMQNVHWEEVDRRLIRARQASAILRG